MHAMATIRIEALTLKAVIGVHPHEQEAPQDIVIDLSFDYEASKAAASDDIKEAVDYFTLKERIAGLVVTGRYNLVERLAQDIINIIMDDARVERASVTVAKPLALPGARSVGVTMTRQRAYGTSRCY